MAKTPVHSREEYVEQAYFFRTCRDRQGEGRPIQEVLDQIQQEILSTTRLPFAIQFMVAELKHSGLLSAACERLPHYFTPFQAFVLSQSESDNNRLTFEQATLILEREATYRATEPTPAGLFVFQIEALSRNRLGYMEGLRRMAADGAFDDDWVAYFDVVRSQLGVRELPELVFVRSVSFVLEKRREEPDYEPPFAILFGEKEGRIARANIGRDPNFFFAALQRQLAYPEVPRPPKQDSLVARMEKMARMIQRLEEKLRIVEQETRGGVDLSPFVVGKDGKAPIDERLARDEEPTP
ncbi:hypothetical protein K2X85_12480 [bacterium]|jgi:hypothetical protein|nr:hypothetical protein [bacterium]